MVHRTVTKFDTSSILLKRGHVIFGWNSNQVIKPICSEGGEPNNVYDSINDKFVRLTTEELEQMGVGSYLSNVQNHQKAIDLARQAAHKEATEIANLQAIRQLHYQESPRANPQSNEQVNHEANVQAIYKEYQESYDKAYKEILPRYLRGFARIPPNN